MKSHCGNGRPVRLPAGSEAARGGVPDLEGLRLVGVIAAGREGAAVGRESGGPTFVGVSRKRASGFGLGYPPREICFGYSKIPWIIAAVLLMMVFGLVIGRLAGVRIA